MPPSPLPRQQIYRRHHEAAVLWLLRSVEKGRGGSCATFSPVAGWSRPYPETTGYVIPTLLEAARRLSRPEARDAALRCGEWLLSIQRPEGAWSGGLHPPRGEARPSVFNTGQILTGMVALHRETGDARFLEAGRRGAAWMAGKIDERGHWPGGDYRGRTSMKSYYAHAAWPMAEVAREAGDAAIGEAAHRVLAAVAARRLPDGSFAEWEFEPGRPAFTHTIAYTLWGLIAAGETLDAWDELAVPALPALDRLARTAERSGGWLPGAYAAGWKPVPSYVCLTGNVQLALCLLALERRHPDLRRVNAACKLVDFVCSRQRRSGAVAGSSPLWGRYMTMRYPNWAAKFHADALAALDDRLARETP